MTKFTTHRIALDRLATALQPDVTQPQMVLAWNLVEQLLRELNESGSEERERLQTARISTLPPLFR